MAEPNDRLRYARERVESPHAPGQPLSRQELADLVNAWMHENSGGVTTLDANYIGKLERGIIRCPNQDYRAGLRAVLGVGTDRELGFQRPRWTRATVAGVDRKDFLRTTLGVTAGAALRPLAELVGPTAPPPIPSVVGQAEVDELRAAREMYSNWDDTHGGGLVRVAINAQLQHAVQLLHARCPERLRPDLFSAVGSLSRTAGFMAFDQNAYDDAASLYQFALVCSEEARDWHLRAAVYASVARQAFWLNDPDHALTNIEMAMVRADRLTAIERALLGAIRARALALLGRAQETAAAIGYADEAFGDGDLSNVPVTSSYYDHAEHMGETGHALADLAVRGKFISEAHARLATAISQHDDGYLRARTFCQIRHASLTMTTGDPREAAAIGTSATITAAGLRSQRVSDNLRVLRQIAAPHNEIKEVAELRERIGATVALA